jgi:hypothetical protein
MAGDQNIFNIRDLYTTAFGGPVAAPFPAIAPPSAKDLLPVKSFDTLKVAVGGTPNRRSEDVGEFVPGTFNGAGIRMPITLQPIGGETYILPNEPIVSVSASNQITTTSINRGGKRFTVKEEWATGDYRFQIKGLAINLTEDYYPEAEVAAIRRLRESNTALLATGLVFKVLNVAQVVITAMSLPRADNLPMRVQPYELTAVADEDFELILNES